MKKMDSLGLKLCKIQADVFESSALKLECSSAVFVRRFMNSKVARRMEQEAFLYEACDVNDILNEIIEEYGESSYGRLKYNNEELHWMGYIYRYWSYTHDISCKQVYRIIKPEELRRLYFVYHSFDPEQAIERIKESKKLLDEDMLAKGVALMRKLYNQEKELYEEIKRAKAEYELDHVSYSLAEVEEHIFGTSTENSEG